MSLFKAYNMAMKAELLIQEKFKLEAPWRNYNSNNCQPTSEKYKSTVTNTTMCINNFKEEKAMGKQKEKEVAEKRNPYSYANSYLGKCFKCNQPGHRSNDYSLGKGMQLVKKEADEEEGGECRKADWEKDGYDEYDKERTYVIRRLILALKQVRKTQRPHVLNPMHSKQPYTWCYNWWW